MWFEVGFALQLLPRCRFFLCHTLVWTLRLLRNEPGVLTSIWALLVVHESSKKTKKARYRMDRAPTSTMNRKSVPCVAHGVGEGLVLFEETRPSPGSSVPLRRRVCAAHK